jgi:hypothetical protein
LLCAFIGTTGYLTSNDKTTSTRLLQTKHHHQNRHDDNDELPIRLSSDEASSSSSSSFNQHSAPISANRYSNPTDPSIFVSGTLAAKTHATRSVSSIATASHFSSGHMKHSNLASSSNSSLGEQMAKSNHSTISATLASSSIRNQTRLSSSSSTQYHPISSSISASNLTKNSVFQKKKPAFY